MWHYHKGGPAEALFLLALVHVVGAARYGATVRRNWKSGDHLGSGAAVVAWVVGCLAVLAIAAAQFLIPGDGAILVGGVGFIAMLGAWLAFAVIRIIADFLPASGGPAA